MMKNILKICLIITLFFVLTSTVKAEGAFDPGLKANFDSYLNTVAKAPGYNTSVTENSATVMTKLIAFALSLVGIIFLILVIWSGIQWMTAGGSEDKIGESKKRILRASVGLGITLSAFIISYTVYSFLSEQYLDTSGTEIGAPPGSQTLIACASDLECEDRAPRIFCDTANNNCVECLTDDDCPHIIEGQDDPSRSDIPYGSSYCHPTWNICMQPEGTSCNETYDIGLCLARSDCRWVATGEGGQNTWIAGSCYGVDDPEYSCGQCTENAPICILVGTPPTGQCFECYNRDGLGENIIGACDSWYQWCSWDHTCMP